MNKYDEKYIIRLGKKEDIDSIMRFIDTFWKKNHILARDKKLFEYEFLENDQVNMILAIEKSTNEIEGIFGFLQCSKNAESKKDIWGSLWKVVDTHDNIPFLGVELAKRVYKFTGCRMHIGNGANPKTTIPLRKIFFGDKVAKMKQYYLLNPNLEEFSIAVINNRCDINDKKSCSDKIQIKVINTFEEFMEHIDIESFDVYPYKDNWYIKKRYFKHPYYKYKMWGLEKEDEKAVIVARELEVDGKMILRIIDYIGNHSLLSYTSDLWRGLFSGFGYEYIDFFEYGIDDDILENAGFILRKDDDENIIPNYFEPFCQTNVDIWCHYKYEGTTFFKGDCDQDRPNIFREGENNG